VSDSEKTTSGVPNHGEPAKTDIDAVKSKHADRSVHRVTASAPDLDEYVFIMTGASQVEYEKYQQDMLAATEKKDLAQRTEATISAARKGALAQIKWPAREQVVRLFDQYPLMPLQFTDELGKMAGDSFEVRSKKL
jgi:hypothetical protein